MKKALLAMWFGLLLLALPQVAKADDEWTGVSAEDLGISQDELTLVKSKGMSKARVLQLLEIGISPNEYFSEPWKKLGVTEDHWVSEKKAGMEDDDINTAYRKQGSNAVDPIVSFFLPGFYHYKTQKLYWGLGLSTAAVACLALTFFEQDENKIYQNGVPQVEKHVRAIYPIGLLVSMVWSSGYALINTRYQDNQDATRFSWNAGVSPNGDLAALLALNF